MFRKKNILLAFIWVGIPLLLRAQDTLPQYNTDSVQILDLMVKYPHADWELNSLQLYPGQSLAGILQQQTGVYIKSYGPGALASPSIRGGSAAHTQIIWNGLPVNNLMNGQSDLNLLQSEVADKISLESGGSISEGGVGAVSGMIKLEQNHQFNSGLGANTTFGIGSFGTHRMAASAKVGQENFYFGLKSWIQEAENNFPYTIPNLTERGLSRQVNARVQQEGVMLSAGMRTGKTSKLILDTWTQRAHREIPPVFFQSESEAIQKDQTQKAVLKWEQIGKRFSQQWMSGYSMDYLNYQDARSQIDSKSRTHHWIQQGELKWIQSDLHTFKVTIWGSQAIAQQEAYSVDPTQIRFAVTPSYQLNWRNLNLQAALRQEWLNQGKDKSWLSAQPQTEISWIIRSGFIAQASIASVCRLPSLNDLYWSPGGNPDLLPERGYHSEIGYRYEKTFRRWTMRQKSEVYYSQLKNRIFWMPSYQYWTATNIGQVYSCGFEMDMQLEYNIQSAKVWLGGRYLLNETRELAKPEIQLLYIPANTAGLQAGMKLKNYSISISTSYTGFVFTSSDQSNWLPAWHTTDIKLSRNILFRLGDIRIFIEIRNLMNTQYQVMEARPMPGRSYFGGIQWTLHHKRKL